MNGALANSQFLSLCWQDTRQYAMDLLQGVAEEVDLLPTKRRHALVQEAFTPQAPAVFQALAQVLQAALPSGDTANTHISLQRLQGLLVPDFVRTSQKLQHLQEAQVSQCWMKHT